MPVRADKESSMQLYRTWRYVDQPSLVPRSLIWMAWEWGWANLIHTYTLTLSPPYLHPHTLTSTPIPSYSPPHLHPHTLTSTPTPSHSPPHLHPHSHLHTYTLTLSPPHPRLARVSCPTSFPRAPWCSRLLDARPKFWNQSTLWGKQRSEKREFNCYVLPWYWGGQGRLSLFSRGKKNFFVARCGARTHDPEIKSLMLYRLS